MLVTPIVHCKVTLGWETRRFALNALLQNGNGFISLVEQISKLFSIGDFANTHVMFYRLENDSGEWITLATQEELNVALEVLTNKAQADAGILVLHIAAVPLEKKEKFLRRSAKQNAKKDGKRRRRCHDKKGKHGKATNSSESSSSDSNSEEDKEANTSNKEKKEKYNWRKHLKRFKIGEEEKQDDAPMAEATSSNNLYPAVEATPVATTVHEKDKKSVIQQLKTEKKALKARIEALKSDSSIQADQKKAQIQPLREQMQELKMKLKEEKKKFHEEKNGKAHKHH